MAEQVMQTVPDSRPRVAYVLPDGTEVAIIFDHGEHQPQSVTYQLGDGSVVYATKKPPNQYAVARRREKVSAFSTVLDRALRQMGIDPDSALAAEKAEGLTDADYEILRSFANAELPEGAKLFGTPSPEAREQFRELYRARCRPLRAVAAFDGRTMADFAADRAGRS